MGYNRLGATTAAVIALYPGTVEADYGTAAVIEDALDRATDQIMGALSTEAFAQLTEPTLQLIVRRATAGATTATLGLVPVVAGSLHLWVGQPAVLEVRPRLATELDGAGISELGTSAFTLNATTGLVTLNTALAANDQVLASYQVDVTAAAFSVPSLARLAVRGAASSLGERLYTQATQEWALVDRYREDWAASIDALADGSRTVDELRLLRWWSEVERTGATGGSVRLGRG